MGDRVLLVDDDSHDQALIRSAFRRIGSDAVIDVVPDAEAAIDHLRGGAQPVLAIVDLKVQGASGLDLLRWIRHGSEQTWLPVVVLSGSADRTDIRSAYDAGANAYMVKPRSLEEIDELVRRIDSFWLGACALANDPVGPGGA